MYSRALVCCVFITTILTTVRAECSFPPDHPSFSLSQDVSMAQRAEANAFYVYTDRFGNCSGCVTELHLCYADSQEPVLTVAIMNDNNTVIHTYNITVETESGNFQTSCSPNMSQGETTLFCCATQTLEAAEQFEVQDNFYYGLRTYLGTTLLVNYKKVTVNHFTLILTGGILVVGDTIPSYSVTIIESFFYFSITPGNCSPVHASSAPTQTRMATSTSSSTTATPVSTATSLVIASTSSSNVSGINIACSSTIMPVKNNSRNTVPNVHISVVIGVSVGAGVSILIALLLGSAMTIKIKARKPHGTNKSRKMKQMIETASTIADEPNTSHEADGCIFNEASGLTISPGPGEACGVSQHEQQTASDDEYVVNQLDYTDSKTLTNAIRTIPTTSNVAYGFCSIPTSHNEAYGALGCQHDTDDQEGYILKQYFETDGNDIWNSVMQPRATELHS